MPAFFDVARFEVDKAQGIVATEVYQEIARATMTECETGTYEYGMSITSTYDTVQKSQYIRFSIDGGSTWTESISEPKDKTDATPNMYLFYKEGTATNRELIIEARKEDTTGVMTVNFVDAWIKRVK